MNPSEIQIDIRGQKVTRETMKKIEQKIVDECNGALGEKDIKWIEK